MTPQQKAADEMAESCAVAIEMLLLNEVGLLKRFGKDYVIAAGDIVQKALDDITDYHSAAFSASHQEPNP